MIQMAVLNSVAEWPPGERGTRALLKESGDRSNNSDHPSEV